jgi:hypothetical protein
VWGAMKRAVYKDKAHTLLEMKKDIANFIKDIPLNEISHFSEQHV